MGNTKGCTTIALTAYKIITFDLDMFTIELNSSNKSKKESFNFNNKK